MQARNIPRNIRLYSKRSLLWNSNSYPYLSGDLFADMSDVSLYSPRFRVRKSSVKDISDAQVIFCPSHHYEEFLSDFGRTARAKVLILGNSDRDFLEPLEGIPKSVRLVMCQNLNFEDPRYCPIPIGIENSRLATNGLRGLFDADTPGKVKQYKVLFGPFSKTHAERTDLLSLKGASEYIHFENNRLTPKDYSVLSSQFKFIASPRGNGLDTHRFWEALYRGAVPIVRRNSWSNQMRKIGIPLAEVANWTETEIESVVLNSDFNFEKIKLSPPLWWPWWDNKIRDAVA
jgi:hypothetical protein